MIGICENLLLYVLIRVSLIERNDLIGFIINITFSILAYALSYKWFARVFIKRVGNREVLDVKNIKITLVIAINVLIFYIFNVKVTVYYKGEIFYVLLQFIYVVSLIQLLALNEQQVIKKTNLEYNKLEFKDLMRELNMAIEAVEKHNDIILKQYNKVKSLKRIEDLGLNIHEYTVCFTLSQLIEACKKYEFICSIRTDTKKYNSIYKCDYPFYAINSENDFNTEKFKRELFDKNYIAIVTNGLRYDKDLMYNIVINISENGDFMAEYSFENTPLRKMYINSKNLHNVHGNINEDIALWDRSGLGEGNKLDLRILRDLLIQHYEIARKAKLFDRYLEISVYSKECGILKQDLVYWEI